MTLLTSESNFRYSAPPYPNFGSKPCRLFKKDLVDDREAISAQQLDPAILGLNFYNHYFRPIELPSDLSYTPFARLNGNNRPSCTSVISDISLEAFDQPTAVTCSPKSNETAEVRNLRKLFEVIKDPHVTKSDFAKAVTAVQELCTTLDVQYPNCLPPFTSTYVLNGEKWNCFYDGATPLCHTIAEAEEWKVRALVQAGASLGYCNACDGFDPFSMSVKVGRASVSKYLLGEMAKTRMHGQSDCTVKRTRFLLTTSPENIKFEENNNRLPNFDNRSGRDSFTKSSRRLQRYNTTSSILTM